MAAIRKDKNTTKGSYILMNDLALEEWKPIVFNGTFNGNGYTITIGVSGQSENKWKKFDATTPNPNSKDYIISDEPSKFEGTLKPKKKARTSLSLRAINLS